MVLRRRNTEAMWKAGLFMLFCLGLFVGMLLVYGKVSNVWRGRQEIHVLLAQVSGLNMEAPVTYNGIDVGRVKSLKVLNIDPKTLKRMPALTIDSLEGLPFDDATHKALRRVPETEFDAQCREALLGKTMIELTLEVIQEGDFGRYKVEDTVHVKTSVMGNASVEIVAGSGRPIELGEDVLLLGYSGDFLSGVSRSMEQVGEVLTSVTDVVGADERRSFTRATGRMDGIMEGANKLADTARKRMTGSRKKFDEIEEAGADQMGSFGTVFQDLKPDSHFLSQSVEDLRADLAKKFGDLLDNVNTLEREVKDSYKPIKKDVDEAFNAAEPHVDEIKTQLMDLFSRSSGVKGKVDRMYHTSARAMEQSMPELDRTTAALGRSFINLLPLRYIRERIGEIVGKKDLGENEFYTARDTYHRLKRIGRWPRDVHAELGATKEWLRRGNLMFSPVKPEDIERIQAKIKKLELTFQFAESVVEQSMLIPFTGTAEAGQLPPFPRKRAGVGAEEIPTRQEERKRKRKRR